MDAKELNTNNLWLVTEDGVLKTYNYDLLPFNGVGNLRELLKSGLAPHSDFIPIVNKVASYWPNPGGEHTYQSHWIANIIRGLYEERFGLTFQSIDLLANVYHRNALSHEDNNLDYSYFIIGSDLDNPVTQDVRFAWPSIIGHEFCHAVLHEAGLDTDYNDDLNDPYAFPNVTLHEGISDMLGM